MNAAAPDTVRLTHLVASEIHRALAAKGMTVEQLAAQIIESPAFIRRVLVGEDGLGKLVHLDFIQAVADATGKTLYFRVPPNRPVKRKLTVKGGEK